MNAFLRFPRLSAGLIFSALNLLAWPAAAQPQPPEDVATAYYTWVLAHPGWSLPSARERAQLARFMAPSVVALLKAATEMEKRCIEAAPKGDKPSVLEGDLFVGNYEGASEVAYGEVVRKEEGLALLDVNLMYVAQRVPKAHPHRAVAWKDQLEMRLVDGRWRVSDVKFHHGRSLVASLDEYVKDEQEYCVKR